jgi:flagellar basal body-associated protein FliL
VLIHYEAYNLKSDAQRREKFLKTTEGKRLLRQQIKECLNKFRVRPIIR